MVIAIIIIILSCKQNADTTGASVPIDFNPSYALRIIGYDISNLPAAIQALRTHFIGIDKAGDLTEPEKKVLYLLMQKFL